MGFPLYPKKDNSKWMKTHLQMILFKVYFIVLSLSFLLQLTTDKTRHCAI